MSDPYADYDDPAPPDAPDSEPESTPAPAAPDLTPPDEPFHYAFADTGQWYWRVPARHLTPGEYAEAIAPLTDDEHALVRTLYQATAGAIPAPSVFANTPPEEN